MSGLIISHTEIRWYLPYFTKERHKQPIIQSHLFLFICSHRSTSHLERVIISCNFPSKIRPWVALALSLVPIHCYIFSQKNVSGYVCNHGSLSVGHSESRRMTDELGSRQRDLSTSSVTKRANGHWHAIIASSCRWSQREYKRQPVHRINHPFASEPSGGVSLLLFLTLREASRVRALRHSSGGRGLTGEQRSVKTVTQECAVASSPACFSTKRADFSKRVHGWSRLFKDVLSPVRFWVRSISGASGRSRSLPHVSGLTWLTRSWPITQGLPLALSKLTEGTVSTDLLVAYTPLFFFFGPNIYGTRERGPRHKPGL